jgi:hypothetical protein
MFYRKICPHIDLEPILKISQFFGHYLHFIGDKLKN